MVHVAWASVVFLCCAGPSDEAGYMSAALRTNDRSRVVIY